MLPRWTLNRWCFGLVLALSTCFAASSQLLPPPEVQLASDRFALWQEAAAVKKEWASGPYLNALIMENSPYLLQHAGNPVSWLPWSADTLTKAAAANQLIFLSIGYSTCHWCHVMNRESFSDPNIARLINQNFTAIKVDREEMPAIDRYYANVLAMVKGSAGWPITAILDSAGKPIFVESYLSPDDLQALLGRVVRLAAEQPEYLQRSASFLAAATAAPDMPVDADTKPLSLQELTVLTTGVLGKMDTQFGGLAGPQKFPNEAALLFLSTMRQHQLNPELGAAIDTQLAIMARGGIYDHVNGGFFRYATDRTWTVPHYEKMLYNQGLLLQAYSEALAVDDQPLFRFVLDDVTGFLQRWLGDEGGGYYSAVSADTREQEGLYYLWVPEELSAIAAVDGEAAGLAVYAGPSEAGLQGITLQRPDSSAAGQLRLGLRRISDEREKPYIDRKIIAAWNGAVLSGLLAATRADSRLANVSLTTIERSAEQVWARLYSQNQNMLYRVWYQGKRQIPGALEDYAYMARALLDLYDATEDRVWLQRARLLADLILVHFVNNDQMLSTDSRQQSTGVENAGYFTDGELPAADAVALQALWRLAIREGDQHLRRQLQAPIGRLRATFRARPWANLYAGGVLAEIDLGSVATRQYFAGGNGRINVSRTTAAGVHACSAVNVEIKMAPGWHVNSSQPFQQYLRPTRVRIVEGNESWRVAYPVPDVVKLGFDDEPLSLYQGHFWLSLTRELEDACSETAPGAKLAIDLQACSDEVCLAPETLTVRVENAY